MARYRVSSQHDTDFHEDITAPTAGAALDIFVRQFGYSDFADWEAKACFDCGDNPEGFAKYEAKPLLRLA